MGLRLITIPLSHYCERARWALEYAGLDFAEERHLQLFHRRAVQRWAKDEQTSVPLLVTDDGRVLHDSADIVEWASHRAPTDRSFRSADPHEAQAAAALERQLAGACGEATRLLAYALLLPHRSLLLRYNNHGAPWHEGLLMSLFYQFLRRKAKDILHIDEASVHAASRQVRESMRRVDTVLERQPYLSGSHFGSADLTFAALLAPLVMPAEYGSPLPSLHELPAEARRWADELRGHRAGDHVLQVYRNYRRHRHHAEPHATAR